MKFDTNHDGNVTYKEFVTDRANRARKLMSPEKAEEMAGFLKYLWETYWSHFAEEKDGILQISCEAFVNGMNSDSPEYREIERKTLELAFHEGDQDQDGFIDVSEFALFHKIFGADPKWSVEAFKHLDKNGDGKLSRDEFIDAGEQYFCDQEENEGMNFWGQIIE